VDISDYGDEWCEGFLAGQASTVDEIQRLVIEGDCDSIAAAALDREGER
jgi:hypothetical protein